MGRIIEALNSNAGVFNLAFGAIVAIATVFYARLTKALVEETRRMRRAQTEPHLLVQVEVSPIWINFVNIAVRNIGGGAAYGIKLSLDRDFADDSRIPLSEWGPFKHGIRFLAPGQGHERYLTSLVDQLQEIERPDGRFEVNVAATYANALGEQRTEHFPLDFRQFIGLTTLGTPANQEIATALKKFQDDFHYVAAGFRKLSVDLYTDRDRRAERAERLEHARAAQEAREPKGFGTPQTLGPAQEEGPSVAPTEIIE